MKSLSIALVGAFSFLYLAKTGDKASAMIWGLVIMFCIMIAPNNK